MRIYSPLAALATFTLLLFCTSCLHEHRESDGAMNRIPASDRYVEVEDRGIYPEQMAGMEYRLGISDFRSELWDPLDTPVSSAILYRSKTGIDLLEIEVGGSFRYEKEGGGAVPEQRARFYEIDLGLGASMPINSRKLHTLEPYFGGGLAILFGRTDIEQGGGFDHFDDADTGYYLHGGLRFFIKSRQYVSVDWQWLRGTDLDLGSGSISADGRTISIGFGFSF